MSGEPTIRPELTHREARALANCASMMVETLTDGERARAVEASERVTGSRVLALESGAMKLDLELMMGGGYE